MDDRDTLRSRAITLVTRCNPTLSGREIDRLVLTILISARRSAKGRGVRWVLTREIVLVCASLVWPWALLFGLLAGLTAIGAVRL